MIVPPQQSIPINSFEFFQTIQFIHERMNGSLFRKLRKWTNFRLQLISPLLTIAQQ